MGIKTGPKLVVDHMITYQLLGMPEFWDVMPGLLDDLRTTGEEACRKALHIAMGQTCGGCSTIRQAVLPAHNLVWARIAECPDASPFVSLITAKRGYRPSPVEVYYKDEAGATHALRL